MFCTFFLLFHSTGSATCGGKSMKFRDLGGSATEIFKNASESSHTIADLIVNKLTPQRVDMRKISDIDLCENHKKSLTINHKSLRRKNCGLSGCNTLGEKDRRISLDLSSKIFCETGEHVVAGDHLCWRHRTQFTANKTETVSKCVSSQSSSSPQSQVSASPCSLSQVSASLYSTSPQSLVSASHISTSPQSLVSASHISTSAQGPVSATHCSSSTLAKVSASHYSISTQVQGVRSTHSTPFKMHEYVTADQMTCSDYNVQSLMTAALYSVSPQASHHSVPPQETASQCPIQSPVFSTRILNQNVCESKAEISSTPKRKCFTEATENLPKLFKSDSESSFVSNSQPLLPDSQYSNYSNQSDVLIDKKLNNFNKLMSCLREMYPATCPNISNPLDLTVKSRTLREYATSVGEVWKTVLETITEGSNYENLMETSNFLKMVFETVECKPAVKEHDKVLLSLNVLESLQEYYHMACSETSRSIIATRKQILHATCGKSVRDANQLNQLAETLGARRATVDNESKTRKLIEERKQIVPYLTIHARKSPEGSKYVTEGERLDIIYFYENELVSEVLKGHNNVISEIIRNKDGSKAVFQRQKRVLKISLCELLPLAQTEIGYKYSLTTLINLRPSWVLLAKHAHYLTCLCDRCVNVQLILKCLSGFVKRVKLYGQLSDKASLSLFELSTSVSDFISKVLHPKLENENWYQPACYFQSCSSVDGSLCGSKALRNFFQPLISKFGPTEVQLFQHLTVSYNKADGTKGSKMEQVESQQTIVSVVDLLDKRLFGKYHKQPYILHRLKMLLGNKMRKDVHQNILSTDVVCYTDYSKELEVLDQEQCKSSAFGSSNVTIQLIGQIMELKVVAPSPPTLVAFDCTKQQLTFSKPAQDGGSNIQSYEVHLKSENDDQWYLFKTVNAKMLSQEPDIPDSIFGRLSGNFSIRILARNLCCLSLPAEIAVVLTGDLPFSPQTEHEMMAGHFEENHATFYREYYFFSDHGDAPKNYKTIQKCKEIALQDLKQIRDIKRVIYVSDTGGENNGSTALCCYSFSEVDHSVTSIWSPTAAHHSGQLSDSACGTLKRLIKNDLKCGKAKFLNTAEKLVKYCRDQPVLREVNQSRFLKAKTMMRSYYHVTQALVETGNKEKHARREVVLLAGVSKIKQAWSTGSEYQLLVRDHTCCCKACLQQDFTQCDVKEYVGTPRLVQFVPVRQPRVPSLRCRGQTDLVRSGTDQFTDILDLESDNSEIQESEPVPISINIAIGDFCIVLGDSLDGYYLVKCLSTDGETFFGKYFTLTNEKFPQKVSFRETQESDKFFLRTIVSEVSVSKEMVKKTYRFSVNKSELDEILLTISELSDI